MEDKTTKRMQPTKSSPPHQFCTTYREDVAAKNMVDRNNNTKKKKWEEEEGDEREGRPACWQEQASSLAFDIYLAFSSHFALQK